MSKPQYFLIESQGHLYCVSKKDILVADPATIKLNDEVHFKYGAKTFQGPVTFSAGRERIVMDEIKKLQKIKNPKKEDSFHDDKPRKAALIQRERMKAQMEKRQQPSTSKKKDEKVKIDQGKKREAAKLAMEDELLDSNDDNDNKEVEDDEQTDDSSVGSSESDGSASADSTSKEALRSSKIKSNAQDLRELRELQSSDSGSESSTKIHKIPLDTSITDSGLPENMTSENNDSLSRTGSLLLAGIKSHSNGKENSTNKHAEKTSTDSKDTASKDQTKMNKSEKEEAMDQKEKVHKRDKKRMKRNFSISEPWSEEKCHKKAKVKKHDENKSKKNCSVTKELESVKDSQNSRVQLSDTQVKRSDKPAQEITSVTSSKKSVKESDSDTESSTKASRKYKSKSSDSVADKKKHRKSKKRSRNSSESDSEPEDKKYRKKSKKRKSQKSGKRNLQIYDGQNYLYSEATPTAVKLHNDFEVYVRRHDLEEAAKAKTLTQFIRQMTDKIYTREALQTATPQGFPPRGKGRKFCKTNMVPPRLHPDGLAALIAKATELEVENKMWRPKTSSNHMKSVFSTRVSLFKTEIDTSDDSSESSSSESDT